MTKPFVLAVVGATASGKSDLALQLARRLDGEIVCMDSMQIYRRMDIGTAKPTAQEQQMVPHHMLDIVEPTENYAVADYARDAETVIRDIVSRGRLPILTGGTGLYLKALMHGLNLGGAGSDEKLREKLNALALEKNGKEQLHAMLAKVDPASAQKLHPNDIRRVIRAIEVYELTGTPISQQKQEEPEGPFRVLPLAIDLPRPVLYERLENRVHIMMVQGLLYEVEALLESGVTAQMQSMQGIGYKELIPVVQDGADLKDAVWQIILNTRHYAKRQGTWLRTEPKTVWLQSSGEQRISEAMENIERFESKGTIKP
ncbi:MAG: tRNA (adenosine(37)-N6)-dimethylallyltransferase MiaA [Clostridia bacterium]|nr:tRNA (adenosine(37)-N6)-dimethylallyltransferase MiaA [Clostridia bacterium]